MNSFEEALAYLQGLQKFGMKPGLARTEELLRRLGAPHHDCGRVIHITGTNGKGSVAALVEAALRAAGCRVGLYTSPALEHFTERIQLNRQPIPPERFAALMAAVRPVVEAMVADGCEQPTEFEVVTAAAFLYFHQERPDWLVLEVGLGGRFDSTTVVPRPVATAITTVAIDHVAQLGESHEAIAWDKAGVIKPGVPCVTGALHPGALAVIAQVAAEAGAPLHVVPAEAWRVNSFAESGQVVELEGARRLYQDLHLSLLGRHQAANAAVALRLLEIAGIDEAAIRAGFGACVWPGRMEMLGGVLLDGAHNESKAAALAEALCAYFPGRPLVLVLGVLADKNVTGIARHLVPLADQVVVTTPANARALPAAKLAEEVARLGAHATVIPNLPTAVLEGRRLAAGGGLSVVTGSLYTVGPARSALRQNLSQL